MEKQPGCQARAGFSTRLSGHAPIFFGCKETAGIACRTLKDAERKEKERGTADRSERGESLKQGFTVA
jgi:hypothetical protein